MIANDLVGTLNSCSSSFQLMAGGRTMYVGTLLETQSVLHASALLADGEDLRAARSA